VVSHVFKDMSAKILEALNGAPKKYSGDEAKPLGLSIGISMYSSESGETIDHLLNRADEAMYNVKRQGKGGFSFADYDPA